MPDGTGFWLAAHGVDGRLYVHSAEYLLGLQVDNEVPPGQCLEEPRVVRP